MPGFARVPRSGRTRLALAGGSPERKDMLMKVGLGLLVVAVAVAVVMSIKSIGKKPPRGDIHFECQKCGTKFGLSVQQVRKWKKISGANDYSPPQFECPSCKEMAALRLDTCPACGEDYLPSKVKKTPEGHPICPKCGVDIIQYRREHRH